jgi:gas vesicle protein
MNSKDVSIGVLVGICFGFGLGCILAPRSGQQTRNLLAKQAKRTVKAVKSQTDDLLDTASDVLDDGRSFLAEQQKGLNTVLAAGKKAYRSALG